MKKGIEIFYAFFVDMPREARLDMFAIASSIVSHRAR